MELHFEIMQNQKNDLHESEKGMTINQTAYENFEGKQHKVHVISDEMLGWKSQRHHF